MYLSLLLNSLLYFIFILLSMAFFTLLERKILGYSQIRKGPNKVGIMGIPQPLADAMKLLSKEMSTTLKLNISPFIISPFLALFLSLLLWILYPSMFSIQFLNLGLIMFLCISSFNVYTILAAGWASNSKYSLLGTLRSMAQSISYEISMSLIILGLIFMILNFNFNLMNLYMSYMLMIMIFPSFIIWFMTTLAESNRTPFDLTEGESELVSGFNTEYSSGLFTLIFMAEYMNILFLSLLTSLFFIMNIKIMILNSMFLSLKIIFFSFFFLLIRATLPRMRYDCLMSLTWKCFLPYSLLLLILLSSFIFNM
uniref:NADH-ubiquinone oxidoreductase chain 1 n=1 Tax=Gesiella jameensis TaxID=1960709 RepID=A0A8E7IWT6_9ANNE|nr:NADH dehydrogenase subunit 1 [Gesiella jameensis]